MFESYICHNCIEDESLKKFIKSNKYKTTLCCYQCRKQKYLKTDLDNLIGYIFDKLYTEYDEAGNGCGWVDGEYFEPPGGIVTTYELLEALMKQDGPLIDDIASSIDDISEGKWCHKEFYGNTDAEELHFTWQSFCESLKHEVRYFIDLIQYENEFGEKVSINVPQYIKAVVNELNLFSVIPKNKLIYRIRVGKKEESFNSASELGTAPKERARSNRMSAAGISMFYGAFDQETAVLETTNGSQDYYLASFRPSRNLHLVDFTKKVISPSIFDADEHTTKKRAYVKFFDKFLQDFTAPIEKNDCREHIEYVPTQVITEFFKHKCRDKNGIDIDGIIYPSSKNHKHAIVLFVSSENCVDNQFEAQDEEKNILKLILTESQFFQIL